MYCMYTVHWTNRPVTDYSEAEFFDVIGTKALRVFLLAIHEFGFCSEFSKQAGCLNKATKRFILYLRIMTTDHKKIFTKEELTCGERKIRESYVKESATCVQ